MIPPAVALEDTMHLSIGSDISVSYLSSHNIHNVRIAPLGIVHLGGVADTAMVQFGLGPFVWLDNGDVTSWGGMASMTFGYRILENLNWLAMATSEIGNHRMAMSIGTGIGIEI